MLTTKIYARYLPDDKAVLKRLADDQSITLSDLIRQAVEMYKQQKGVKL